MTATAITLTGLGKSFGMTDAVQDLSLELAAGSFTALLGPSGCGKSTTLSMLAGLTAPDRGDIHFDGASILDLPAERRPVGLVFQKPLLFPHLTVADNVGFGLRMRGMRSRDRARRVAEMLDRVQLGGLGERRVGELSGGQEQRVALARALVLEPDVLLLDEPFSQLDTTLRAQMRALLRRLHVDSGITTVFVTHDQGEAVEVADTIALMLAGTLAGHGTPESFYTRPETLAGARFFGVTNEITGRTRHGRFSAPGTAIDVSTDLPDGDAVLVIRPEMIQLEAQAGVVDGRRIGRVVGARFAGTHVSVDVELGHHRLRVHHPAGRPITIGQSIGVDLRQGAYTVFTTTGR
ncbi:ABC-type Fe3+/spermidine/putrescine transport system ATPase subunit [Nakamurella sp. UYEF19]|uniref:ABC transporter ATP-binding protein n=1 Tax=Nakamurella sp. UYEF19 TaxID=1756392 RepID=UPI0033922045